MKIKQLTTYLESIAPLHLQEDYDNAGLLTGNTEDPITAVMISLDCTEAVIDEAIKKNCNMVISHHPVIFKGLKKLTGTDYIQRTVLKAIQNNIALYAIHTNLDNVPDGVSRRICDRIGIRNPKVLLPISGQTTHGSGMIGKLQKPMNGTAFLKMLKSKLKTGLIRHTALLDRKIETVAVCGGSGSFLLERAKLLKADAFVTGDFKYHQFFDADNQILIADVGHYESEQFTPALLKDLIQEKFGIFATPKSEGKKSGNQSGFPVYLSAINTNPINYL